MDSRKLKLLAAAAALVFAGRIAAADHFSVGVRIGVPAPIVVREAPPRAYEERIYASPGRDYVWVKGHYTWNGRRWDWVRGVWMLPPQPGAIWVDGNWDARSRQWVEAHWEAPAPPPVAGPPGPPPGGEIYADYEPPAPIHEVVVARPGPEYVWIGGFYGWEGGRHVWHSGHWERPPHERAQWVEPRWERRGGRYAFVQGYWR